MDAAPAAVTEARSLVAAVEEASRVALAYDAVVAADDERSDAVVVEAHERGEAGGLIFAQRYRPAGRLRRLALLGDPAFVEDGEPLLAGPTA